MVRLAPVQRLLHVAPQSRRIDIVQQVEAAMDVVQLPQGLLRPVLAGIRAELADDDSGL